MFEFEVLMELLGTILALLRYKNEYLKRYKEIEKIKNEIKYNEIEKINKLLKFYSAILGDINKNKITIKEFAENEKFDWKE